MCICITKVESLYIFVFLGSTILAKNECIICQRNKTAHTGTGYEELIKCVTIEAAVTLIDYARNSDDQYVKTQLMNSGQDVVIAKEFKFHRTCYRDITRAKDRNESSNEKREDRQNREKCFQLLKDYVSAEILTKGRILRITAIAEQYAKIQKANNLEEVKGCIHRNLKTRLINTFGDDLTFFSRNEKSAEIVYGSNVTDHLVTDEEMIVDAAKMIKDEIMALKEDASWPPDPEKIRADNVKIPKLLETFLKTMFTKDTPSVRVKRLIKSIGQDLIYNTTRGVIKTVKHTQLGLFVKRITGSRQMIDCLNRLGHVISYHEVNSLETAFAELQIHNQLLQSYVPPPVVPSIFVTFVFDNCDHNPETLNGVSMHVTNGIIIQLKRENQVQVPETNVPRIQKRKSFTKIDNELLPYKASKRLNPPNFTTIERNENALDEYLSKRMDLLWLLLRIHSYLNSQDQNVPAWTGFYYEV